MIASIRPMGVIRDEYVSSKEAVIANFDQVDGAQMNFPGGPEVAPDSKARLVVHTAVIRHCFDPDFAKGPETRRDDDVTRPDDSAPDWEARVAPPEQPCVGSA